MREIAACPYRGMPAQFRNPNGQIVEYAPCGPSAQALIERHSVGLATCRACVAYDDIPNPIIQRVRIGWMRMRILTDASPAWASYPGGLIGLKECGVKWLAETGGKPEALQALLEGAVKQNGMDPKRAAECMETIGG